MSSRLWIPSRVACVCNSRYAGLGPQWYAIGGIRQVSLSEVILKPNSPLSTVSSTILSWLLKCPLEVPHLYHFPVEINKALGGIKCVRSGTFKKSREM
jgi:hypothetical protein